MRDAAKLALEASRSIISGVEQIAPAPSSAVVTDTKKPTDDGPDFVRLDRNDIFDALTAISEPLGLSYLQVKLDIRNSKRYSWAGTAHEIRQVLSSMLELLAPDGEVVKQSWYKQDPTTKGPTQAQRARHILEKRNIGSREMEVVKSSSELDQWISGLVRATYNRASDAAHRFKQQREAKRILQYFEAFASDLLDLK